MARDYGQELDLLKKELDEIRSMLMYLGGAMGDQINARDGSSGDEQPREDISEESSEAKPPRIYNMRHMHPDKNIREIIQSITDIANRKGYPGAISYVGVYSSGGRQSNWVRHQDNIEELFSLIENHQANNVLNCIGNGDRLNLLLQLLRQPQTVAQLMESGGYGSTGQVYHHLKILQAADLLEEVEQARGVYAVKSHRMQGIIMLLSGIRDMVDPKYSQGEWDVPVEPMDDQE